MTQPTASTENASARPRRRWSTAVVLVTLLAVSVALGTWFARSLRTPPLAELSLADGRTFLIEAVTFGTNHVVGRDSPLFNRVSRWFPHPIAQALQPKGLRSEIATSHPSLVVWVNAIDSVGGTNVDCQSVRLELGDGDKEWFGGGIHWFGGVNFWRVGHVFSVYPRQLTNLTVRITPWRTNAPAETVIVNPSPVQAQSWRGSPLPQERSLERFTVRLDQLNLQTNHPNPKYYQTSTRYWDPICQILEDGQPAAGWQTPAWTAEDPTGNRGVYLGAQQPVLRYSVICYPSSTNEAVAELVATLPSFSIETLKSNQVQNSVDVSSVGDITFIGAFPRGSYVFEGGVFLTNPPVKMGPVGGGAPSGWTGQSRYVTPVKKIFWDGHYTHVPVIYLHADLQDTHVRLGLRLRAEDGLLIPVQMEPQGGRRGVWPFLITDLQQATVVTPEIVLLHPLEATFDVDTTTLTRGRTPEPAVLPEDVESETVVDVFW